MIGSYSFSAISLTYEFNQILIRVRYIAFNAVRTPSGMPWYFLVIPQGLPNAPATYNQMITQVLCRCREGR